MERYADFTGVLYNTLKHNTALWKYLNKGTCRIIILQNDTWWLDRSLDDEGMTNTSYDELHWVMEEVFHKKCFSSLWYTPSDKYTKEQLIKG